MRSQNRIKAGRKEGNPAYTKSYAINLKMMAQSQKLKAGKKAGK